MKAMRCRAFPLYNASPTITAKATTESAAPARWVRPLTGSRHRRGGVGRLVAIKTSHKPDRLSRPHDRRPNAPTLIGHRGGIGLRREHKFAGAAERHVLGAETGRQQLRLLRGAFQGALAVEAKGFQHRILDVP